MTDIDYAGLREKAEKATPGPWHHAQHPLDDEMHDFRGPIGDERKILIYAECESADAEFIAAANPQTVLALLDDIDGLRRANEFMALELQKVGYTDKDAADALREHDAALIESLAEKIRHKQHAESIRQMLINEARERREGVS